MRGCRLSGNSGLMCLFQDRTEKRAEKAGLVVFVVLAVCRAEQQIERRDLVGLFADQAQQQVGADGAAEQ